MKNLISKISIGAGALLFSAAGMAATVTMSTPTLLPGTSVFLVTISGSNFVEDLENPVLDQTTIGATLGISYSSNMTYVGPLVQCPTTSGTNCPTGTVTTGTATGSGLPASGPFALASGGAYNPHFTPADATPNTPPTGTPPFLLTTFDITTGTGASGSFDVVKLAFQATNMSAATITLIDNGGSLSWFQLNEPFDIIPVTYGNGGPGGKTLTVNAPVPPVPVPAAAWLLLSGLGSLVGIKRLRRQ
jgi:hypothetical protein